MADLETFRAELRSWLAENVTDDLRGENAALLPEAERVQRLRAWQKNLAGARWVGITWAREFGGRAATIPEQVACPAEMARARSPEVMGPLGICVADPPLIGYGN